MKTCISFLLTLGLLCVGNSLFAQGTAFTYQGQLSASGNYDFTFALFTTNSTNTGQQVGSMQTNLDVNVTNGLFIVTLNFGGVFTGSNYWLSIGVRPNGSSNFTALNPLQELTPTPYAIYTPNAGNAATATSAVTAGSAISATSATTAITATDCAGSRRRSDPGHPDPSRQRSRVRGLRPTG